MKTLLTQIAATMLYAISYVITLALAIVLIGLIALVGLSSAHAATCDLQPMFEATRVSAERMLGADVPVSMAMGEPSNAWGEYRPRQRLIVLDKALCDLPQVRQQFVIAHELGHFMALSNDATLASDGKAGVERYHEAGELTADMYGARLLSSEQRGAIQTLFDKLCAAGDRYGCQHAERWAWAKIH